jgi:hypothetical protein
MRLRVRPTLLLVGFGLFLLLPKESAAVPQFSRRYNIKCSACHTIAPVLNEQGWMFKRLGFHLPPALEEGQVAALISDLVKKEPEWKLTNNVSVAVADFSYSAERTTAVGTPPTSTSAFQVAAWNNYFGGWIPDTNFFYFAEFDIVTNGVTSPALMNANFGYSGGNARSSWYIDGGREHLQIGEGTRAAQIYSLLPNSPLLFENPSPTTFVIDQSPVGIDVGYTWASSSYKRVFAATAKVTNGDNADGTEIIGPSNRNSKDAWLDLDYWYAPESGITFLDYYGKKDQANTDPLGNQFTFHPSIRRQGFFGNYMYDNTLDFTAGYLHSHDDWEFAAGGPSGIFLGNDYYVALDYYIVRGLAISGRFDRLNQQITGTGGVGKQNMHDWTIGASKTLTLSGNIIARIAYSNESGSDPVAAIKATDKLVQADIAFNF